MAGAWLRLEWRRRWRSLLVLALLLAVAGGAVLATIAGARRGVTSIERLDAATLPATAQVHPVDPRFDWDAVRAVQGVAAVGEVAFCSYELDGTPVDGPVPADGNVLRTVERPVVLDGRLADPDRADEAVVTPRFVRTYGHGVGDTVTVGLYRPVTLGISVTDWRGPVEEGARPPADGPEIRVHIVGVVRSPLFTDMPGAPGWLVPTAAFFAAYSENLLDPHGATGAMVRLDDGGSAYADFAEAVTDLTGRTDLTMWSEAAASAFSQRILDIEATAVTAFALAAGAAAVVLVGQAIARHTAAAMRDLRVLGALGLSPRQQVAAAAAGPTLAGIAGMTAGVGAAVLASAWFPIGTAEQREPAPGVDADWTVLAVGWSVVVAAVAGGCLLTAAVALRASRSTAAPRRSPVAAAVARSDLPLPLVLGTRLALEPGRGRQAVPVRPALVGAVAGIAGTVAALTLAAGVGDAVTTPARYGQVHALEATLDIGDDRTGRVLGLIAADPDVAAVNDSRSAVAQGRGASPRVYTYQPVAEPLPVVVDEGRLPATADEVALGPFTAETFGVGVGDTVELTGTRAERRLTVTGLAFLPEGQGNYNIDGGWVTGAGFDALFGAASIHVAHIAVRDGADPAVVAQRLDQAVRAVSDDVSAHPALQRDHSVELLVIRGLPLYLALFLAVLAVAAVGHALAVAVRRRRRDLAVLRALGLTGGQCRGAVVTQSLVIVLAGLVIGAPLGVAAGSWLWRYITDAEVIQYVPPPVLPAVAVVVPAAVLAAVALAAWPARRAGSFPVWQTLRAE
ncbi:FtsX-like permease family protein [Jiangella alkaliphila]|uniref:ABC-type transport system, involved in lipoprotein release, permease component n=2 Tax=Jiangella alkaliphila TaxID=419479 RepID=A0A1H2M744_9ACTN|nr:FtsX-like permease family protein [Jiangella alkaliphila]SDU88979.1 ABC-type transport system, involved in lipoprotein release, permease component [Jiangella alkaliphila]